MGFLDEIRETLRRPTGLPEVAVLPPGLVERVRRVAFDALQRRSEGSLGSDHADWADEEHIRRQVKALWAAVDTGLFGDEEPSVKITLVERTVGAWLERSWSERFFRGVPTGSLEQREVDRLMMVLQQGPTPSWRQPARYLVEVGAVDASGVRRTRLGELLLRLGPRDQVIGLLHAEALQSTGPSDHFRLPRWVFAALARRQPLQDDPFSWPAGLTRLVSLGLLLENPFRDKKAYIDDRVPWFEEAANEQSPLGILVRSALEDHAQATLGAPGPTSGAAVHELAELVRHELGNVVGSLGLTVGQLRRDAREDQVQRLERLEKLTTKLDGFAASLELLAPGTEPVRVVELLDVLNDALAKTAPERNGHLTLVLNVVETLVTARSGRIGLLFENLIRNAAQAAHGMSRSVTLTISIAHVERGARLVFEDDGPGVPEALEGRMFERGMSGRGSSGLGLAIAREIAREHGGELHHERPASVGARFVLTLLGASDA